MNEKGKKISDLAPFTFPIAVVFSSDGKTVLFLSNEINASSTPRLGSVDGKLGGFLRGHTGIVGTAAFSPDGRMIATGADDKTVRLWNSEGVLLETLTGHADEVRGVAFTPDGKTLVTGSKDKTVKIWSVQ